MEEKIKRAASRVKMSFVYFWLLPVFLVIFGETGGAWVGLYAGDVRAAYFAETITILSWVLVRKIDAVSISDALRLYVLWSGVRLALLAIPVVAGFLTYYMVLSNKGVLCALIALTASLFCLPGEKRLREELHIDKEQ